MRDVKIDLELPTTACGCHRCGDKVALRHHLRVVRVAGIGVG
jgi:hypothetical protein